MTSLILLHNCCLHHKLDLNDYKTVVFAPMYVTYAQKQFYDQQFEDLKLSIPPLLYQPQLVTSRDTRVYAKSLRRLKPYDILAWDAYDEKVSFGESLIPMQNRLFPVLPFTVADSFTQFRKQAEKCLPSTFSQVVTPHPQSQLAYYLDRYFSHPPRVHSYFQTRNTFFSHQGFQVIKTTTSSACKPWDSTGLSAYLAVGSLDVKYLYNLVSEFELKHGESKSSYWIKFELLWREFFYWHYHKHTTYFFSQHGIKSAKQFSKVDCYTPQDLIQTQKKKTIHPLILQALRELDCLGVLSNRMRQIFASYWINELGHDWRAGALLFENYLIDYDVYSNYGNWMYLAGVGVDPRGPRKFNLEKQIADYNPSRSYLNFSF